MLEYTSNKKSIYCIISILFIYCIVVGSSLTNNGGYQDDRLYLYSTNFLVCDPGAWDHASREVVDFLHRNSYDAEYISRFQFRFDYSSNYLLHAATTCLTRLALPQDLLGTDYGTWVYAVLETGVGLGHLICLLIVAASVWTARKTGAPLVVLAAIAVMAAFALGTETREWRLLQAPSIPGLLLYTMVFVVNPGFEFDIFGLTPRSAVTLLLIAITVFRWGNRFSVGYWIIAFACFVHGTYGTLALVMFVGIDVLLRPAVIRNWHCLLPIAVTVVVSLLRIRSFDAFGGTAIQLGALIVGIAVFSALVSPIGAKVMDRSPPVAWCKRLEPLHAEAILYFLGMCLTLMVAVGLAAVSSGLTVKYVAQELSGRPIAMMRIPFMLSICAIVMRMKFGNLSQFWPVATAIMAAFVIGTTLLNAFPIKKTWLRDEEMRPKIQRTLVQTVVPIPEDQLYFVLSCHLDRNCTYMNSILSER